MDEELLKGKTLLVVDDEADLRDIVASELEFMGAKVFQAENITVAKNFLKNEKIELIVSDIRMPGGTGIDLLGHVKSTYPVDLPVLLITGFADITVEDAFDKGAEALMNKPFKLDDLIRTVERFVRPLDKRFEMPELKGQGRRLELQFSKTMAETIHDKQMAIGRGGLCLNFENGNKKTDLNEPADFILKFKDQVIQGVGVPRWVKHLNAPQWIQLGLEFLHLEGESLKFFLEHCHSNPKCEAYIPKL